MELKVFIGALAFSVLVLLIALGLPESKPVSKPEFQGGLPWQIEHIEDTTRVFGLTLGNSTLADAEKILLADSEISLFRASDSEYTVEAYFDKVELGGLTAKMILVMSIPPDQLAQMFRRGVRISKAASGSNKVSIATEDLHRARAAVIQSITYLPAINLDEKQIQARFGTPAQRVPDPQNQTEHWLYPQQGLDVTLDEKNKEVLQYVIPSEFARITQPLMSSQPLSEL